MSIFIFLIISYILLSISLYKLFEKAGEAGWKALVPGYNFVVWNKIIGQPAWKVVLLLVPLVNIFVFAGMCVDMVRSFGKFSFFDSALAVIYAPIHFFKTGWSKEDKYVGPTVKLEKEYALKIEEAAKKTDKNEYKRLSFNNPYKKSVSREWTEAIVFAVFAAAFIRMFFIEPYKIPTGSMEGSLNVGDFLFVSKAHYGMRMPMTIAMFPLIHNTIPFLGSESYLKSPSIPYTRLPAIESLDRNDPVVFNLPDGDSIYITPQRNFSHGQLKRANLLNQVDQSQLRVRPVDKRDHYVKRCIATPGDKFEIKDRQVYINDQPAKNPKNIQFSYRVTENGAPMKQERVQSMGIYRHNYSGNGIFHLTEERVEAIKKMGDNIVVTPITKQPDPINLFPHDRKNFPNWSIDNFGPFVIPKKGVTVTVTPNNIALYRRIITAYEGNTLEIKNGRIFINGKQSTSYTFKMDYYWMMGDNRHNSEDARSWGFVPEDHIVGKPLFIWFSTTEGNMFNGINWDRIFSGAQQMD